MSQLIENLLEVEHRSVTQKCTIDSWPIRVFAYRIYSLLFNIERPIALK